MYEIIFVVAFLAFVSLRDLFSCVHCRKGAQIKPARRTPTQTISMKLNTDNAERYL